MKGLKGLEGSAPGLLVALAIALVIAVTAGAQTPSGTVTAAVHTFAKEVLDPSLDSTVGRPYHGPMFDWFIGATPAGKLSLKTGVLESYKQQPPADTAAVCTEQ